MDQQMRRPCAIDGCARPAELRGRLCSMHRGRMRRGTPLEGPPRRRVRTWRPWTNDCAGYLRVYAPEHPLAGRSGMVYAHRIAAYAAWGPGPRACWRCGRTVAWEDGSLQVHHLRFDPRDCSPEYLAAACASCQAAVHEQDVM
jgi:hypothetical protein